MDAQKQGVLRYCSIRNKKAPVFRRVHTVNATTLCSGFHLIIVAVWRLQCSFLTVILTLPINTNSTPF